MQNKKLLIAIVVVLLAILGVVAAQYYEEQKSPGEKISEGFNDLVDDVGDEIDGAVQ